MNLQEYKSLLQHPENITAEQTVALQSVIRQYPYLQSAYAMRLKGLYNENSYQYNHTLKLAAAYTTDRTVLFDFITSVNFAKVDQAAILEEVSINTPKVEISKETEIPSLEKSILNSIEIAETSTAIPAFEEETEEEFLQEINSQLSEQSVLDSIEQAETSTEISNLENHQIPEEANISSDDSTILDLIENSEFESTQIEISEEDEIPLEMIASTDTDKSAAEVAELQNTSNHEIEIDGH